MKFQLSRLILRNFRIAAIVPAVAITGTIAIGSAQVADAVPYKNLHDFYAYPDGAYPFELVRALDGNFYGITQSGGNYDLGAIIKVTQAGVSSVVYSFPGFQEAGQPYGGLTLGKDGGLYGVTVTGGSNIYKFNPSSNTVTLIPTPSSTFVWLLHKLVAGSDGALYGSAEFGGTYNNGVIVRYMPGGSFSVIHSFTPAEGSVFVGCGVIASGSDGYLYGITKYGGANGLGIVFKMNYGGAVIKLRDIAASDGFMPSGPPTVTSDNAVLFPTDQGGPNNSGSIFKIGTNGKSFSILRGFAANEPNFVNGALLRLTDGKYYGGISGDSGDAIFSLGMDGSYNIVHKLSAAEGQDANAGLVQGTDGLLYGTAIVGGQNNVGTVFRVSTAGNFTRLSSFRSADGADVSVGVDTGAPVVASDGNYYGATNSGGMNNLGTIYRITPAGAATTIHSFNGAEGRPAGLTLGPDGQIYGATATNSGGASMIYRLGLTGAITPIHTFSGDQSTRLTLGSDNRLYGATQKMIYKIDTAGNVTKIATLTAPKRIKQVVLAGDGNLYCAAPYSGPNETSVIYKIMMNGNISIAFTFDPSTSGICPTTLAVGPDGNLYGSGASNIFRLTVRTGAFTILRQFTDSNGESAYDSVVVKKNGVIYFVGNTFAQHPGLFSVDTNGAFTLLAAMPEINFAGTVLSPSLALTSADSIYGTWSGSGKHSNGVVYRFAGF